MTAQTIRHPWFNNQPQKRKRPPESDSSFASPPTSQKRFRCTSLEGGFSHLSLNQTSPMSSHPPPLFTPTSMSIFEVPRSNSPAVVVQGSVEEPPSPDVPEIKMRNWYEPEKDRMSLAIILSLTFTELSDRNSNHRLGRLLGFRRRADRGRPRNRYFICCPQPYQG
jgi:hypothetical protein